MAVNDSRRPAAQLLPTRIAAAEYDTRTIDVQENRLARPPFKPTDVEAAAIRAGEEHWKFWRDTEQLLTLTSPADPAAVGELGAAARKTLTALDRFRRAPLGGHTVTLIGALQSVDLPLQAQDVQRQRIERLYEDLQLIARSCEIAAPGPGAKINSNEARFVWCAADAWCRMVGSPPTAKGRFHKAIASCASHPSLRNLTPERVAAGLARWRQFTFAE